MELPPSTSTVGGTLSTNGVLRAAAAALAAAAVCYKQQKASKANDGAPSSLQIAVPPPSSDTGLHTSSSESYLLQNRSRNPFQPASATQALPITFDENNPAFAVTAATRRLLPTRLIFVRHGQSEANADHSLLRTKPDNLIELTDKGLAQAQELGKRIKAIVGDETVGMVVSPFLRTMQTARNVRLALDEEQMVKNVLEPRLREQEFGNLQGDEFIRYREEQGGVGRFWYRFPTGESGCDVYARVSQWMEVALPRLNMSGQRHIENLVVVSHGLTMRLALMHLAGWSPNTFHTVWNADNCQMYLLEKDESLAGFTPYAVSPQSDRIRSSLFVKVEFSSSFEDIRGKIVRMVDKLRADPQNLLAKACPDEPLAAFLRLENYLELPQPRTRQGELVKTILVSQHRLQDFGIDADMMLDVDFHAARSGYREGTPAPRSEIHYR